MPAQAVIVNADDLGLWPSVNQGIFTAWTQRVISDSTVLANAPDLTAVLATARAAALPVGIHLNLTLGQPLCDPAEIPALVTPDGRFMKRQQWTLPLPMDQVRRELSRQAQRVLELGWQPSHLDSHHHVHRYPEVLAVVIELAHELRLPVRAVDAEMREQLHRHGIATPDHFSMAFYAEAATAEMLIDLTEHCPGGVLEIMTHPGYVTPDLPSSYRDREQELSALTDHRWRAYLAKRGINIVGFNDLPPGS